MLNRASDFSFLLDPVRNQQLAVNEAVKEGVVGPELHHKLLSAERAVTGYKDPYMGEQISLFQAMKKDLIVRDHGICLLKAQITTGGIIDPVHSRHVPVDVAYQHGYFNEEMNRILADPSDDTKGFFNPNTHENLLQLLEHYKAAKGGKLVYTDSEACDVFEKATVSAPFGKFQGKTSSTGICYGSSARARITMKKIIKIVITVVEE
ncbi:hypothetical protein A6R68_15351 [Neotoma lepida]|uniref:Uncharacterized protein n=1 Tax=Neotoma lepida TaxID=56216 RepID=A0A1A6H8C0_NEOLE|nr:hypothetical protein A6R68_15351 [Neotoma lepida]